MRGVDFVGENPDHIVRWDQHQRSLSESIRADGYLLQNLVVLVVAQMYRWRLVRSEWTLRDGMRDKGLGGFVQCVEEISHHLVSFRTGTKVSKRYIHFEEFTNRWNDINVNRMWIWVGGVALVSDTSVRIWHIYGWWPT